MRSEDAVKLEEFMRLPVQEQLEKARKDPIEILLFIAYLVGYSGIRDDWAEEDKKQQRGAKEE